MMFSDYFTKFLEGIEFLRAFGSIMGFLGLVLGILMLLVGEGKNKAYKLIVVSIVLIAICGLYTGVKYFRI